MNKYFQSKKKNILLGILIAIGLLIGAETCGQIVYFLTYKDFFWNKGDPRNWSRFTLYGAVEYIPNSSIKEVGNEGISTLGVDCNGFVHNGYNRKISENDYLVVICGGSTVLGYGSTSNNTTIAAYLERILKDRHNLKNKNIRVINAGHRGYTAYQQFSFLTGKILPDLKPKIVIDLDGYNDAFNVIGYADHGWKPNWQPYFDRITSDINSIMRQGVIGPMITLSVNSLKKYSTLITALDRIIHGEFIATKNFQLPQKKKPSSQIIEHAVNSYIQNHILSHTACTLNEVEYYVLLQPVLLESKKKMTTKDCEYIKEWNKHFKNKFFWLSLEEFYSLTEQKIERIPYFIDISDLFMETKKQVYCDRAHYKDLGNLIIAQKIVSIIEAHLEEGNNNFKKTSYKE